MDVLQFIVATQYTHTKKTNADCFKVHVFPEKCPLSGRFQSNSFEDLSKELSKNSIQKGYNIMRNGKRVYKSTGRNMA